MANRVKMKEEEKAPSLGRHQAAKKWGKKLPFKNYHDGGG